MFQYNLDHKDGLLTLWKAIFYFPRTGRFIVCLKWLKTSWLLLYILSVASQAVGYWSVSNSMYSTCMQTIVEYFNY